MSSFAERVDKDGLTDSDYEFDLKAEDIRRAMYEKLLKKNETILRLEKQNKALIKQNEVLKHLAGSRALSLDNLH